MRSISCFKITLAIQRRVPISQVATFPIGVIRLPSFGLTSLNSQRRVKCLIMARNLEQKNSVLKTMKRMSESESTISMIQTMFFTLSHNYTGRTILFGTVNPFAPEFLKGQVTRICPLDGYQAG